jgi:hypothetical protein
LVLGLAVHRGGERGYLVAEHRLAGIPRRVAADINVERLVRQGARLSQGDRRGIGAAGIEPVVLGIPAQLPVGEHEQEAVELVALQPVGEFAVEGI